MTMKKCPNCGKEFAGNMKFCTQCGTKLEDVVTNVPPVNNANVNNAVINYTGAGAGARAAATPPVNNGGVKPRSIALSLIFTLVTCGLYGLYWIVKVTDEMNTLLNRRNATGGLMSVIFTIITCGFYGFYWAYKLGDNVDLLKGNRGGNTGILYLILYIFLFGIINLVLAQDVINDKLEGIY